MNLKKVAEPRRTGLEAERAFGSNTLGAAGCRAKVD